MPGGDRDRRSAGDVVTPRSSSASSRRSLLTLQRYEASISFFFSSPIKTKPRVLRVFSVVPRSIVRHAFNLDSRRERHRLSKRTSMLSINMRIFKTVLLLAAFFSNRPGQCLPVENETSTVEPSSLTTQPPYGTTASDHYDQRQNGTENYRIHVDGVIFLVAPAETLLLAGIAGDNKPNLPATEITKPPSDKPEVDPEPSSSPPPPPPPSPSPKSAHRASLRLANLLVPLLRRIRQE
ncbi:uncharacterized protein LOC143427504 [Xylocopa sonorina]|uniref:uncharacterized protein LOC143427504 n=1 Tax=Xylocopa sonorina TaxID=1818115 RepID=UPI00403AD535